jgi:hypothetical protein
MPFSPSKYSLVDPFSFDEDDCADDEKGEDKSEEDIIL